PRYAPSADRRGGRSSNPVLKKSGSPDSATVRRSAGIVAEQAVRRPPTTRRRVRSREEFVAARASPAGIEPQEHVGDIVSARHEAIDVAATCSAYDLRVE